MSFLKPDDGLRRIDGKGVYLRHPEPRDYQEWSELREASRAFLTPWEPTWPDDDLSRGSFRYKLRRYAEDARDGRAYAFFIFNAEDNALVGGATLSRVQRGVALSCSLGYWVGAPHQRRGYTSAGVRALARYAFDDLALHRVEAACQPDNEPSRSLLKKVGFTEEGFARAYLRINGDWRDHVLFGLVAGDPIR
ncbi:MAG: GNAT family N-acetyltransferase [Hyphomonadaceae bacterium]|nr:GNAT family N-acetyltransferase [Hyphomonadaceae bacterium]